MHGQCKRLSVSDTTPGVGVLYSAPVLEHLNKRNILSFMSQSGVPITVVV